MTTLDEFGDHLSGEILSLSATFLPPQQGELLRAVFALRNCVIKSAHTSAEQQVCQTQLAWWHDELDRLRNGEARHPASKRLAKALVATDRTRELMQEWVVLAQRIIERRTPENATDWQIDAYRHYGAALQIAFDNAAQPEMLRDCSNWLSLLELPRSISLDQLDAPDAPDAPDGMLDATITNDRGGLAMITRTCKQALLRMKRTGRTPGALYLLWLAWRSARTTL
ncbi:MAG: hypothetical protein AAGJ86_05800 [Pseudomonadota bacterium]